VERESRLPLAPHQHARQLAWDVPICGQTTLGSGQTKALLDKPEYWAKVYPNNFRPVCYRQDGSLPDAPRAFVDRCAAPRST
jgi:branched-chain amino acid transport system substrate-binding protein